MQFNYYYTSVSDESLHVVTRRPELRAGEVDGEQLDAGLRDVPRNSALLGQLQGASVSPISANGSRHLVEASVVGCETSEGRPE